MTSNGNRMLNSILKMEKRLNERQKRKKKTVKKLFKMMKKTDSEPNRRNDETRTILFDSIEPI